MSRFIGEAEDFRQAGEPRRLLVTRDLLAELGVTECSRAEQKRAVHGWLAANRPNQVLARALLKDGFVAGAGGVSARRVGASGGDAAV